MNKEWISINTHVDLVENEVVELLFSDSTIKTIIYSDFQFILASRLAPLIHAFGMYTHYRKSNKNPCWIMSKENEDIFNSDFPIETIGDEFNTYQRAKYIEGGFYIQVSTWHFELFEIPPYGGKPYQICERGSINEIIDMYKEYTK